MCGWKVCQFFHRDVIFNTLPKLEQIYCVIRYYIEIKDFLYLGKFFISFFFKLVQNEKDGSLTLKFRIFTKYFKEGVKQGNSLASHSQILQNIPRATYRDQKAIEISKLGTMHNSWDEKFDLSSIFQNLEI